MKSIKFLSAFALLAVMASCSEDLPNPPAQTYPEPDGVFEDAGLVMNQAQQALNLVVLSDSNVNAQMAVVTEKVNFPDAYTLKVECEVSGDENFSKTKLIESDLNGDVVEINPDILNGAIQDVITKKPGVYDVYVRYAAYAVRENTKMRLGGANAYYGSYKYSVTTLNPTKVIEENYYIVGNFCDWNVANALKMTNTVAGANQYDNPQFSIKIEVSEEQANEGYQWMVIPESTVSAGNLSAGAYGCRPDTTGVAGVIYATDDKSAAGVITNNGPQLITINLSNDTYQVSYALDVLYAFSSASRPYNLHTSNFFDYTGVAMLGGGFYIGQEPKTSGTILFKQDPNSTPEEDEATGVKSGKLTSKSNGVNLKSPLKGNNFYWMEINLLALTYKMSNIATMGLVGDANGWNITDKEVEGNPAVVAMEHSSDFKTWTANGVKVGTDLKICINNAWTLNFGGTPVDVVIDGKAQYNLVFNGDNMQCTPGTYDVVVDFSVYPYTLTLK